MNRLLALLVLLLSALCAAAPSATAQTASCTSLTVGQTQDITAFSVCRKVTLNSVPSPGTGVAGICVPTNTTAAEWASFYNNPPAGVTVAACGPTCTGYAYNGFCYFANTAAAQSCDTTCASYGGCSAAGTRYIGSDDSSAARCSAVTTALSGTPITATGGTGSTDGCYLQNYKGGWVSGNMYAPSTLCSSGTNTGRVCACGSPDLCATGYSYNERPPYPGDRKYSASLWRSERIDISRSANLSFYGEANACNPQPRYNHPFYIQVIRRSDSAVLYQANSGGYTPYGACWTRNTATISQTLPAGSYELRMYMQQNCTDDARCDWNMMASLSCP